MGLLSGWTVFQAPEAVFEQQLQTNPHHPFQLASNEQESRGANTFSLLRSDVMFLAHSVCLQVSGLLVLYLSDSSHRFLPLCHHLAFSRQRQCELITHILCPFLKYSPTHLNNHPSNITCSSAHETVIFLSLCSHLQHCIYLKAGIIGGD